MVFEVVAGIVAHSLALLSDAGHMLTDAGALVLSLVVIRLVQRPSGGRAFVGTLVAGIVIIVTGFDRADAIASLIVAGLMFRSGYALQRKAVRVLLESAPESTAPQEVP